MRSVRRLLGVALVVSVLIGVSATPAAARWRGGHGYRYHGHYHGGAGFVIGFGLGALLTAPFWYRPAYAYPVYVPPPVYAYPAYPYPVSGQTSYAPSYGPTYWPPAQLTPTPQPLSPPPGSGTGSPPGPPSAAPEAPPPSAGSPSGLAHRCETVWVEPHYETQVTASGDRYTIWVPGYTREVCQ